MSSADPRLAEIDGGSTARATRAPRHPRLSDARRADERDQPFAVLEQRADACEGGLAPEQLRRTGVLQGAQ